MNGQRFYCLDCWACGDVIRLPARVAHGALVNNQTLEQKAAL